MQLHCGLNFEWKKASKSINNSSCLKIRRLYEEVGKLSQCYLAPLFMAPEKEIGCDFAKRKIQKLHSQLFLPEAAQSASPPMWNDTKCQNNFGRGPNQMPSSLCLQPSTASVQSARLDSSAAAAVWTLLVLSFLPTPPTPSTTYRWC